MTWWMFGVIVAAVVAFAYLAQRLKLIDLSSKNRSSGRGSGIMSIGDEVFAPTRHEAAIEVNRQILLPAPAPLAGDPDKGIYRGAVVIDLAAGGTSLQRVPSGGQGR
ncbi:MAG TPA: hypothetical protein VIQ26_02485 [Microbacteriaceae bacterium]